MAAFLDSLVPFARSLTEALLNSLWQAAALAALMWCLVRAARRMDAAARYLLWCGTLFAVLSQPLLATGVSRGWEAVDFMSVNLPSSASSAPSSYAAGAARQLTIISNALPRVGATDTGIPLSDRWALLLLCSWMLVTSVMLARLASSYMYLRRLKREASPLGPHYQLRLERLIASHGVRRSVSLRASPHAPTPVAVGFASPVILFPESLANQLSGDEFDQVLLHELAHICRRDDWANLCQQLIQTLLCLNPVAWWIGSRIDTEREMACDDWVVARTGEKVSYAACLARLAELSAASRSVTLAPGTLTSKSRLSGRIEMLLDSKRKAAPWLSNVTFAIACALLAGATLFGAARAVPVVALAQDGDGQTSEQVVEEKAKAAVGADRRAIRALADAVFQASHGIPRPVAGLFKDRLIRAELDYRRGLQEGVSEESLVRAVDELALKFAAPEYARTSKDEVRGLRLTLSHLMPHFIPGQPPSNQTDAERGIGSSVGPAMSPLEAVYVAQMLITQKEINESFQLTQPERAEVKSALRELDEQFHFTPQERVGVMMALIGQKVNSNVIPRSPEELASLVKKHSAEQAGEPPQAYLGAGPSSPRYEEMQSVMRKARAMKTGEAHDLAGHFLDVLGVAP